MSLYLTTFTQGQSTHGSIYLSNILSMDIRWRDLCNGSLLDRVAGRTNFVSIFDLFWPPTLFTCSDSYWSFQASFVGVPPILRFLYVRWWGPSNHRNPVVSDKTWRLQGGSQAHERHGNLVVAWKNSASLLTKFKLSFSVPAKVEWYKGKEEDPCSLLASQ